MKRLIITFLIVVGATHSIVWAQQGSRLERIIKSGELRVGTSGRQPPMTARSKDGELMGYEIELAVMLAEVMNLRVRFVQMAFSDLLPSLEEGTVDVVMSGMTITPERNLKVAFVGPYIISGKSILVKAARFAQLNETAEINKDAIRVAALKGSTSQAFVEKVIPRAKLVPTLDYDEAVGMLINDSVDLIIADYPICALTILRKPEAGLATLEEPLTLEPIGIAMPADAVLLHNLVANYFSALQMTGVLQDLEKKWFQDGGWLIRLP